ncbi:hypothetical protein HGH92_08065 [Chitinophaga varians]|uniref:Uncharacterized protein n=1 Tax=Chitinophaga varians TaxID=2202339 RepID=A0A847RTR2_9BACT|nr:hypothetical protein [Chitinophaga varians]NLR64258.1 hypothetical protein [Chitinophaga varians]
MSGLSTGQQQLSTKNRKNHMQRSDYSHTLCKKDFHIAVKRRYQAAGNVDQAGLYGKTGAGKPLSIPPQGQFFPVITG